MHFKLILWHAEPLLRSAYEFELETPALEDSFWWLIEDFKKGIWNRLLSSFKLVKVLQRFVKLWPRREQRIFEIKKYKVFESKKFPRYSSLLIRQIINLPINIQFFILQLPIKFVSFKIKVNFNSSLVEWSVILGGCDKWRQK